jgi:hypothetical protein
MIVKLGVIATTGKASQDESTGAVISIVREIVLIVLIAAEFTKFIRDRFKKLLTAQRIKTKSMGRFEFVEDVSRHFLKIA